jgi:hypothetical protein
MLKLGLPDKLPASAGGPFSCITAEAFGVDRPV